MIEQPPCARAVPIVAVTIAHRRAAAQDSKRRVALITSVRAPVFRHRSGDGIEVLGN